MYSRVVFLLWVAVFPRFQTAYSAYKRAYGVACVVSLTTCRGVDKLLGFVVEYPRVIETPIDFSSCAEKAAGVLATLAALTFCSALLSSYPIQSIRLS